MESLFSRKPRLLFASLICHRDVEIFMLNWFTMRAQLEKGFDIPHLILHDGTLTSEDKELLRSLPKTILAEKPVTLHPVPKPVYLAKLQGLTEGFHTVLKDDPHPMDRVVVFDSDIFFFNRWDSDLGKICQSPAIAMRDWGSSLGPNVWQYRETFGVHEDAVTPNCNTGMFSVPRANLKAMEDKLDYYLNLEEPFMIMEDQGIFFSAYYGMIDYIEGIPCVITGAESQKPLWDWILSHNGAHLMGMRTRPEGLRYLIQHSLNSLPESMHIKRFTPTSKHISWGLLEFDTYNFQVPLQKVPSTHQGNYIADCMYMHGGSRVSWEFAPRFTKFTAHLICMDTGIRENCQPIIVNGQQYSLGDAINVDLNGKLDIVTQEGGGAHFGFLQPRVWIDRSWSKELGDSYQAMVGA